MFNRLKASFLVVGFSYLILHLSYLAAQSGDSGGGGTNPIVSGGGGGSANTNTSQTFSGTNTFSGPTTFTGNNFKTTGMSNIIYRPITMGTNIFFQNNPSDIFTFDGRNDQYHTMGMIGNANDLYFYMGDKVNNDDIIEFQMDGNNTFTIDGGTAIQNWIFRNDGSSPSFAFNRAGVTMFGVGTPLNRAVCIETNLIVGRLKGGTDLRAFITTNATYDADSILATATFPTNIVCVGAVSNSCVVHASSAIPTTGIVYDAHCITNDAVQIRMMNITAAPIDPGNQRIEVLVITKP